MYGISPYYINLCHLSTLKFQHNITTATMLEDDENQLVFQYISLDNVRKFYRIFISVCFLCL